MQFNTTDFLFIFLPLFLAAYYLLPKSWRMALLTLGSLIFYFVGSSNPYMCVGVLALNTIFIYSLGCSMTGRGKGALLALGIAVLATELIFFKWFEGGRYLPVGMSFYIFQMAAYLVAIYRDSSVAENNIIYCSAQLTMFPKLLMGPLMDAKELGKQASKPAWSFESFHSGLQELILGLGIKVLLSDRLGGLWGQANAIGYESISTPFAWLALLTYAMRLYFDFWGYSIMAVGIGRMLGFNLPENFTDPYASRSVSEFWRRWHASLGAWFKEHLYIPLGGNRKGTARTLLNLLVVWLFTGLWHGVGGNYLVWAMYLFFFVVMERLFLRELLDRCKVLGHIYTVPVMLISWIPFAIGDWGQMQTFALKIFGLGGPGMDPNDYIIWGAQYTWLIVAGLVFATPLPRFVWKKIKNCWLVDVLLFALFWVVVYFISTSAQDPFMYFQY